MSEKKFDCKNKPMPECITIEMDIEIDLFLIPFIMINRLGYYELMGSVFAIADKELVIESSIHLHPHPQVALHFLPLFSLDL
jgi:hypothetical protein